MRELRSFIQQTFSQVDSRISPYRVAAAAVFLLFLWRWSYLLNFQEWGDESETIVAAQMIAAGENLYGDFFNHHGPLTFLPGFLVTLLGGSEVWHFRLPVLLLQVFALAAMYFSPVWKRESQRLLGFAVVAMAFAVVLPAQFGHMYKYQVLAGIVVFCLLFTTVIPVALDIRIGKTNLFTYGALAGSLPFLSISYLPLSAGLLVAVFRTESWKRVASGAVAGLTLNLAFLWLIGSISGYLAYHLYLNSQVLSQFSNSNIRTLLATALSLPTSSVFWLVTTLVILLSLNRLAGKSWWGQARFIILGAALASLLIRGDNFHSLPFLYATLGLYISILVFMPRPSRRLSAITVLAVVLMSLRLAPIYEPELSSFKSNQPPKSTTFSALAEQITTADERVIAWSFRNYEYIASNRLPAVGNYFLLPWQISYEDSPVLGINLNTCSSFEKALPKVVLADKWKVWDSYEWDSYAGCINKSLEKHYWQMPGSSIFIRQSIISNDVSSLQNATMSRVASEPIAAVTSQTFQIVESLQNPSGKDIESMAILFGTHGEHREGKIAISLDAQDQEQELLIDLEKLTDNEFYSFPVKRGNWRTFTLRPESGDSTVSVWSSVGELGALPCVRLGFTDGTFSFTPGCW